MDFDICWGQNEGSRILIVRISINIHERKSKQPLLKNNDHLLQPGDSQNFSNHWVKGMDFSGIFLNLKKIVGSVLWVLAQSSQFCLVDIKVRVRLRAVSLLGGSSIGWFCCWSVRNGFYTAAGGPDSMESGGGEWIWIWPWEKLSENSPWRMGSLWRFQLLNVDMYIIWSLYYHAIPLTGVWFFFSMKTTWMRWFLGDDLILC